MKKAGLSDYLGGAADFRLAARSGGATAEAGSETTTSGSSARSACLRSLRRFRIRPAITTYFSVGVIVRATASGAGHFGHGSPQDGPFSEVGDGSRKGAYTRLCHPLNLVA
jgi:hypothetical protein